MKYKVSLSYRPWNAGFVDTMAGYKPMVLIDSFVVECDMVNLNSLLGVFLLLAGKNDRLDFTVEEMK